MLCLPRGKESEDASEATISKHTYKDAGVDIDAGMEFVKDIKPLAEATRRPGSEKDALQGFGTLFDLRASGYSDPFLVAAADGVGTKLKVALAVGKHDTIGIDLVAMCVNDLIVHGAEPLLFLDYFATGRLDSSIGISIIHGIAAGCKQANCFLAGGETAEMPGMYKNEDYDLAGFALGAVERSNKLPKRDLIGIGDVVLGIASSGIHSNGISLARHIIDDCRIDYECPVNFADGRSIGEVLLTPTKIYVQSCLEIARAGHVKAFAHITGGGIADNVARVLPDSVGADIDLDSWKLPEIFKWLKDKGDIAEDELYKTFNCGVGMVVITSPDCAANVTATLEKMNEIVFKIGSITRRRDGRPVTLRRVSKSRAA